MPLLQNLTTNEVTILRSEECAGLPLAIEDSWRYQSFELELPRNSRLLIYTHGLEEAFPLDHEGHDHFGIEGIIASLKSAGNLPLDDALEKLFADSNAYTRGLFADSNAYTRGHGTMDDTSVLLVQRTD